MIRVRIADSSFPGGSSEVLLNPAWIVWASATPKGVETKFPGESTLVQLSTKMSLHVLVPYPDFVEAVFESASIAREADR
jgi:hypothetical protein